ncbi:low-affinity Fe(II) transport protein [Cokeromyces recurvatus]|uniref:low-affinity Fe(II) transport protein n=1 Tax=Cokeromyces recurvatus TaxID=90255 RepID=UPI0022204E7B|nr:low-affinity Fe(II) transport protein [Cokeromyces recurvatus]KAI7904041.1 low-affinity Fe(II) transport protein [Cokeromyces recurvatus]
MGFWSRFYNAVSSPGRRTRIEVAAPTQFISKIKYEDNSIGFLKTVGEEHTNEIIFYSPEEKKPLASRLFDSVTQYAGSRVTFLLTLFILGVWGVVGIILGAPENWQIVMQDGSSIQCYISDTLLIRQQHNHCYKLLSTLSQIRSRSVTITRIFHSSHLSHVDTEVVDYMKIKDNVGDAVELPVENWFDRCCNWVSWAVGSMASLALYWGGVFAWVGVGDMLGWSDLWQLYINTAVAVELTFTSMFLQNTCRRHMEYLEKCLKNIIETDISLEVLLRKALDDNQPNPTISVDPPKVSRGIRAIDYYGDVVGTGIGAFISVCVFIIWLSIGDIMNWNDNWWLIIGTYTGLVGFIDGFVLRNIYFRLDLWLDEHFDYIKKADEGLYQYLNISLPTKPVEKNNSIITTVSNWMGYICALPHAVLASVFIVVGLLGVASGMKWSETGQLLCNTPTMIIEGFLLIVLIQAHNMSDLKRRVQLHDILLRRLKLFQFALIATQLDHSNNNEKKERGV